MNSEHQFTVFECIRCKTFSTDASLSFSEQHEQMKQHLDVAHPYWDLENIGAGSQTYKTSFRQKARQRSEYFCTSCRTLITRYTKVCPGCGTDTTEFNETNRAQFDSLNKTSQRRQLLGVIGSLLLFIGVFTPIMSVPIVGSLNYFQNGRGDGVIVLVFAVISIALTLGKKYRGLWITGAGSLGVMLLPSSTFKFDCRKCKTKWKRDLPAILSEV